MSSFEKISKFWQNFWYHNKWKVIVTLFFIVVFGVCITQMFTKEKYDVSILYAGPEYIEENSHRTAADLLANVLGDDYDENGKKNAQLIDIVILSDEQIKEREEAAKEQDIAFYYDKGSRNSSLMQISTYISSGETIVCLLDEYVYKKLLEEGAFRTVESVLGYAPDNLNDPYSVLLGDTDLYKAYSALSVIPADTHVCIIKMPYSFGSERQEKIYENHISFFKNLLEFELSD